jgi:hypothetical protein
VQDGIYLVVGLAGWLTVSLVLKSVSVRVPGKAIKSIDEEISEVFSDHHPTLVEQLACAPDGPALLEHYAVLGAPFGSWSSPSDIRAEAAEPSPDEVSSYFQHALQGGDAYVEASAADGPQALAEESVDVSSGFGLLDAYGSLSASCPYRSSLDIAGETEPSMGEMSDNYQHESLQRLLDEASGVVDAHSGSWSSRDIAVEAGPSFEDIPNHFRPSAAWTSSDEPFLNEALRLLLVEASANREVALTI